MPAIKIPKGNGEYITVKTPRGLPGEQGEQGIQGEQGENGLGFNWLNLFDMDIEYTINDVVFYNGSSYVCIETSIGETPVDSDKWNLMTREGSGLIAGGEEGQALRKVSNEDYDVEWADISLDISTLLNFFYPVGTIYETTSANLNTVDKMNAHFGGTWAWFGEGRVTVCVDSTKPEFATLGMTGGHKDLQAHGHTFSNGAAASAGAHTHNTQGQWITGGSSNRCLSYNKISSDPVRTDNPILSAGAHTHSVTGTISSTGAGDSGNLQPYVVVYRYRRTA